MEPEKSVENELNSGKMPKKMRGLKDLVLSMLGLVAMNGVIQLLLYPSISKALGEDAFGDVLSMLAVVSVLATAIGTGVNYARMVAETKGRSANGEFNLFLLISMIYVAGISVGASVLILKEKEKNVRQLCAKLALEYFLQARFACEKFACQNAIVKEFKSVLNRRIASARKRLGYKAKTDECRITDLDELSQKIEEEIGDGFGTINIVQGSNRSCEVYVKRKCQDVNLRLSVYPELSFCTFEVGVQFCVDQVHSVAVQDIAEKWEFDRFSIENAKDENGPDHVLLRFSWDGQTAVEIDAEGPLVHRRGDYSPDLSDEDAENKILWKQLKSPPKGRKVIPFKWGALSSKEFLLRMPLENLDLSVRATSCLKRVGVKTLGDISALSLEDINGIRNLGLKSKHEIYYYMKEKKLPFAFKVKEDDPAE